MFSDIDLIDAKNRSLARLMNKEFISVEEAAQNNNISKARVQQLIFEGKVKLCYRVGKKWIIPAQWRYKRKKKKVSSTPKVGVGSTLIDPSKINQEII